MKLALQVFLFVISIIFAWGVIGEKDKADKKYYVLMFAICILLMVLIQIVWK